MPERSIPPPSAPEPSTYRTHPFDNWNEFKSKVADRLPWGSAPPGDVYKHFLFRGQSSADWSLTSTFDRTVHPFHRGIGRGRDFIAKDLLKDFYEESARQSPWRYEVDDPRTLAMAQHHGLPTRLLDWSFSPYVAAYFAFYSLVLEGAEKAMNAKVAIWALNRDMVQRSASDSQLEIISVQDYENSRLGNQLGAFTYLKTNDQSLEKYLTSAPVGLATALAKLELPVEEAKPALQDLLLMGIHHGTIFPGRDGTAATVKLQYLLRTFGWPAPPGSG